MTSHPANQCQKTLGARALSLASSPCTGTGWPAGVLKLVSSATMRACVAIGSGANPLPATARSPSRKERQKKLSVRLAHSLDRFGLTAG